MSFNGEDYFPEEFLQKIVENTREEDQVKDTKKFTENQTQAKRSNNAFEVVSD